MMLATLRLLATYILGLRSYEETPAASTTAPVDSRPPKLPKEPCFICGKPTRRRLVFHEPDTEDEEGDEIVRWPCCKRDVRLLLAKTAVEGREMARA